MGLHFLTISLKSTQRFAKLMIFFLTVMVAALPFVAERYYKDKVATAEASTVTSVSSFEQRVTATWPDGLALPSRGGHWLTGRGLGGIGVAQMYFEPSIFNSGDNFFVYLWGAFGWTRAAGPGSWWLGLFLLTG
jgi:hypothetical protein